MQYYYIIYSMPYSIYYQKDVNQCALQDYFMYIRAFYMGKMCDDNTRNKSKLGRKHEPVVFSMFCVLEHRPSVTLSDFALMTLHHRIDKWCVYLVF